MSDLDKCWDSILGLAAFGLNALFVN